MEDKRIKLCLIVFCFFLVVGKANAQTPPAVPATISNISEETFSVGYVSWTGTNIVDASVGKWEPGLTFPGRNSTLQIDIEVNDGGIAFFDYFTEATDNSSFSVTLFPPSPQNPQPIILPFTPSRFILNPSRRITVDLNAYRQQTVSITFNVNYPIISNAIIFQARALISGFQLATCPVAPLTPLTDPDAISFENGNQVNTNPPFNLNSELSCLIGRVANAGGASTLTSAYRPPAYQQHLREVYFAQRALQNLRTQECVALKAEVQAESNQHQIIREPAVSSNHSRGRAFDLVINGLTSAQIDSNASTCGLRRFDPVGDPVHFTR